MPTGASLQPPSSLALPRPAFPLALALLLPFEDEDSWQAISRAARAGASAMVRRARAGEA
eukprot:741327-Hanusia_phi.AAC.7